MLEIGSTPSDINIESTLGSVRKISDFRGKYLVIYFYPKNETPGCTKQACTTRDLNPKIQELGAQIVGVSSDSIESHKKFIDHHNLNFELWSDSDKKLQEQFGVWKEKSMFGKTFLGTHRSTFIIDPNGVIVQRWEKASATKNPLQVSEWLKNNITKK